LRHAIITAHAKASKQQHTHQAPCRQHAVKHKHVVLDWVRTTSTHTGWALSDATTGTQQVQSERQTPALGVQYARTVVLHPPPAPQDVCCFVYLQQYPLRYQVQEPG
jgi:hypothetical protein